jgi:hypothetical protein
MPCNLEFKNQVRSPANIRFFSLASHHNLIVVAHAPLNLHDVSLFVRLHLPSLALSTSTSYQLSFPLTGVAHASHPLPEPTKILDIRRHALTIALITNLHSKSVVSTRAGALAARNLHGHLWSLELAPSVHFFQLQVQREKRWRAIT